MRHDKTTKRGAIKPVILSLVGLALLVASVIVFIRLTGHSYETKSMVIGGKPFSLLVADNAQKQELGLGKRSGLPENQGMLFSYAKPQPRLCFWMKDMRFPIDIIWLDAGKRVVKIEPSLSPQTYPNTYCPQQAAQYVIELNAGEAQALRLKPGQKLDL